MTRPPLAPAAPLRRAPLLRPACLALAGIALAAVALPARAAGPTLQLADSRLDLPATAPAEDATTPPAEGLPLYERAPMPNQNAFAPQYDAGGSDPLQPSVISRGSRATDGGGYSRNSSANAAQESRMKPGLGFALHVPTE